jgi:hypothetical protein
MRIAKSAVALATGLPQFYNKLRNSQACGIPLSNLTAGFSSMAIFLVAIRRVHTSDCQDPRYTFDREA